MKEKILLSWSSGKDSAWTLYMLQKNRHLDIRGLYCTVNKSFDRVAMHAVRTELLETQADNIGLPLEIIGLPYPCTDVVYEEIMAGFVKKKVAEGINYFVFGDLFLQNVRKYREEKLAATGIRPLFPTWGIPTEKLSAMIIKNGFKAIITCIDPKQVPERFIGRHYDEEFLKDLPDGVDPCGENGEFHSFVFDGPIFKKPVGIRNGAVVNRDGFVFMDLLPSET